MRENLLRTGILAIAGSFFLASCGGPRATYENGIVTRSPVRYRIGDPGPGFVAERPAEYGDLVFRNARQSVYFSVNSTCNRYEDSPIRRLAENLLWGISEQVRSREGLVSFAGREAYEIELTGKLDGVPVHLYVRVLKRNECIFDFSCTARPEEFETVRSQCERFIQGFEDLR